MKRIIAMLSVLLAIALLFAGADVFLSSLVGAFAGGDPGVTVLQPLPAEDGGIAVPEPGYGEMRTSKYYVLAAAGASEDSLVQSKHGSIFTNGLVNLAIGFTDMLVGDTNRDGKLTLSEAYSAIREYVQVCNASQHTKVYPSTTSTFAMVYQ